MRIVFAGPTLHGITPGTFPSVFFRRPAQCGDIVRAVKDGATVIGLIDGVFEMTPAVWHKEILFALSEGVSVLGAASMGALRAAECHPFGMIGVGAVFEAYRRGEIVDDEDVAQLHGPAELGYLPLSEPLVNIRATFARLRSRGVLTQREHARLTTAAHTLFFKDRTYRQILETADLPPLRRSVLLRLLKTGCVNLKQEDALLLLNMIWQDEANVCLQPRQDGWVLARTRSLRHLLGET